MFLSFKNANCSTKINGTARGLSTIAKHINILGFNTFNFSINRTK